MYRRQEWVFQCRVDRGVDGVIMEGNAGMVALTVQGAMQTQAVGSGASRRFIVRIVGIYQNQVRGLDAREMRLIGIHQKFGAIVIHSHRK